MEAAYNEFMMVSNDIWLFDPSDVKLKCKELLTSLHILPIGVCGIISEYVINSIECYKSHQVSHHVIIQDHVDECKDKYCLDKWISKDCVLCSCKRVNHLYNTIICGVCRRNYCNKCMFVNWPESSVICGRCEDLNYLKLTNIIYES